VRGEGVAQVPAAACCEASRRAAGGLLATRRRERGRTSAPDSEGRAQTRPQRGSPQGTALARHRGRKCRPSERGAAGRGEHTIMLRRSGTSCDRAHGTRERGGPRGGRRRGGDAVATRWRLDGGAAAARRRRIDGGDSGDDAATTWRRGGGDATATRQRRGLR
jgi:hypothetical protein